MSDQLATVDKGGVVWGKPEEATAKIFKWVTIGGLGLLAFAFWGAVLPFVLTTIQSTFWLMIYALGIFAVGGLALSKKVHLLFSLLGRAAFRRIASFAVQTDPIGILEDHVADARTNLQKMDGQIRGLSGEISKTELIITNNSSKATKSLSILQQAQKGAKTDENRESMILNARKAGRLRQSNMTLSDMLKRIKTLHTVLTKVRSNLNVMVEDMSDEVVVKRQEYEAINAAYGAYSSAMKVLNGDSSQRELYEMAMRHLDDNYASKVGEIEDFVKSSAGFLNGIDLQNGMFEEQALKMLEDMEQRSMLLLGDGAEHTIVGEYEEPGSHSNDDVSALFRRV